MTVIYEDAVTSILEILRIIAIIGGGFCLVVMGFRFPRLMRDPLLKNRVGSLSWGALLVTIVEGNFETLLASEPGMELVGPRTMLSFLSVCWTFLALTLHDGGTEYGNNPPWWERGRRRVAERLQLRLIRQDDQPRP